MNTDKKTTTGLRVKNRLVRNEANAQAEIYRRLTNDGVNVMLEYTIDKSRCDLVVIHEGDVKCAIEVKKSLHVKRNINKNGKQLAKYKEIGIPVIYCMGLEGVSGTCELVKEKMLKDEVDIDIYFFR